MIELMTPQLTLEESGIQDGDIICFQVDISDQGARKFNSQGLSSNPRQFYEVLQKRMKE